MSIEAPTERMPRQNRCKNCNQLGHNRATCPQPANSENPLTVPQRQREGKLFLYSIIILTFD